MYSIRIYELLKQYEKIGEREFDVQELRRILKIEKEYSEYKYLKRSVLLPVQKEISEKTDITFDLQEKKHKRQVVSIIFNIRKNKKMSTETDEDQVLAEEDTEKNELVDMLAGAGVSLNVAKELAIQSNKEEITGAIAYAKSLQKSGKVQNVPGFVVQAIRNGFRDNEAEERKRRETETRQAEIAREKKSRWERLRAQHQEAVRETLESRYRAMTEEERGRVWEEFYSAQTAIVRKTLQRDKNGKTAMTMLLGYLRGTIPVPGLMEWAESNAVDLSEFQEEIRAGA